MTADRFNWPVLVRFSLHFLPTRRLALISIYSTATLTALFVTGSIFYRQGYFLSGYFAVYTLWDYLAIRWVDQNSTWS